MLTVCDRVQVRGNFTDGQQVRERPADWVDFRRHDSLLACTEGPALCFPDLITGLHCTDRCTCSGMSEPGAELNDAAREQRIPT